MASVVASSSSLLLPHEFLFLPLLRSLSGTHPTYDG